MARRPAAARSHVGSGCAAAVVARSSRVPPPAVFLRLRLDTFLEALLYSRRESIMRPISRRTTSSTSRISSSSAGGPERTLGAYHRGRGTPAARGVRHHKLEHAGHDGT